MADYLVSKGMPFRTAYKISGEIVALCQSEGCTLETLSVEKYKQFSELFDEEIYTAVDIDECVRRRTSLGGPTEKSVYEQVEFVYGKLGK